MHFDISLGKRHAAVFLGSIAALAALALVPQLLGERVSDAAAGLTDASAGWLWVAAVAFATSLAAAAAGWSSALTRCGGDTTPADSAARYCTGSLVNTLAPARIGSAVRLGLFARTLHNEGRIWTVGGIATSLSAVRALWLAVVLTLGSASGALPRWPIGLLLLGVLIAAGVAWRARNSKPETRWGHAFDVFRVLGRCPRAAARIVGLVGLSMTLRLAAAAAIAAAFGIEHPLAAALLVIPALDLAGMLPLTPGNVGLASAAVAFALKAHGAGAELALTAGIAFGAVEMLTTLALGCGSLLYFAGCRTDGRRWQAAAAGMTGCLALGAAFGATVIVPLV